LNGLLDFLKVIGSHQSRLTLRGLPTGIDPFESLDTVGSRIKELCFSTCDGGTIFQYLSQSSQSKHLEQLKIENTSINSVSPINNLINLAELSVTSLDADGPPIHLNKCLDVCPPALKSFYQLL
jgi:hypothetical protein